MHEFYSTPLRDLSSPRMKEKLEAVTQPDPFHLRHPLDAQFNAHENCKVNWYQLRVRCSLFIVATLLCVVLFSCCGKNAPALKMFFRGWVVYFFLSHVGSQTRCPVCRKSNQRVLVLFAETKHTSPWNCETNKPDVIASQFIFSGPIARERLQQYHCEWDRVVLVTVD